MKKWKKALIISGAALVLVIVVVVSVQISNRGVVTVQTGKVARQDLQQVVTASGEIKPLSANYVNISATAYGRITHIHVKEGDRVKKGQLLAQLESVQPSADVDAMKAQLHTAEVDASAFDAAVKSAEAAYKTALAETTRSRAELERARLDFVRAEGLRKDELISNAEFDARKAGYEVAKAVAEQSEARAVQSKAQWEQAQQQRRMAQSRIAQYGASLVSATDRLAKTSFTSPLDGIVTNLPVREGEFVIVGIQSSPGSLLMTIADMSVVTAEVKVDETDIVNVRLTQPSEVKIDAMPDKAFAAKVTEIGNTAIIRSSGLATSQVASASQEAKDFKVVCSLDKPPDNLRPGLSATAKITTASKNRILTIPIQALTVRQKSDLEEPKEKKESGTTRAAAPDKGGAGKKDDKKELQGVFVIRDKKAVFVPVETGITGTTDIEVLSGLREGDEIITGSYRVLRTLRNNAKVKIDNKAPKKTEEEKT